MTSVLLQKALYLFKHVPSARPFSLTILMILSCQNRQREKTRAGDEFGYLVHFQHCTRKN